MPATDSRIHYFEYIRNDILLSYSGLTHLSYILAQPCYVVFGHVFQGCCSEVVLSLVRLSNRDWTRRPCQTCNRWLDQIHLIKFWAAERTLDATMGLE